MSKTESIPVAMRERDADDMAAYTAIRSAKLYHTEKSSWAGKLTLKDTKRKIGEHAGEDSYPHLNKDNIC